MRSIRSLLGLTEVVMVLLACSCGPDRGPAAPKDTRPVCKARKDCQVGLICDKSGHCDRCNYGRDCFAKEVCSANTRQCELRPGWGNDCLDNRECGLAHYCMQGLCKTAAEVVICKANKDCPVGQRCNPGNFVCEEDLGCFSDPECPTGFYCNVAEHACKPSCTPENAAAICAFAETCRQGRCAECLEDSDCKAGLTCNVEAGKCQGSPMCFHDRDCVLPAVCNLNTHECGDRQPPCLQNFDCGAGQRCVVSTGRCVSAGCAVDKFEPNGSQATAFALPQPGEYGPAALCGTAHDWYSISLKSADRLQAVVDTDPLASQQFRIRMMNLAGNPLALGDVWLDRVVASDGTYFLDLATSDPEANYGLRLSVSRAPACTEDSFDLANWNGDSANASVLGVGNHYNLVICAGDEDWFTVNVATGQTIQVALTSEPTEGDLDLVLYDGATELARSATGGALEQVSGPGSASGSLLVRVFGASGATQNFYDLQVNVQ